jgi:hypothetical protein
MDDYRPIESAKWSKKELRDTMARSSIITIQITYRNAGRYGLVSVRPAAFSCQWSSNDNTTNDNDRYRQPTMDRPAVLGVSGNLTFQLCPITFVLE